MDVGNTVIQLTIIEQAAREAREAAAKLVCLKPHVPAGGRLTLVGGNGVPNPQAEQMKMEFAQTQAHFKQSVNQLIGQTMTLQQALVPQQQAADEGAGGD